MSLTFERLYPWLLAGAAMLLAWLLPIEIPNDKRSDLLSASISVGSIFAGFLTASKTILMALPSDSLKKQLKDSGYIEDLANRVVPAERVMRL